MVKRSSVRMNAWKTPLDRITHLGRILKRLIHKFWPPVGISMLHWKGLLSIKVMQQELTRCSIFNEQQHSMIHTARKYSKIMRTCDFHIRLDKAFCYSVFDEEEYIRNIMNIDTRLLITRYGGGIFQMRRRDLQCLCAREMHARAKIIIYVLRARYYFTLKYLIVIIDYRPIGQDRS